MNRTLALLLSFFVLLLPYCIFGQSISGKVVSTEDKQGLPFALVYVEEFHNGVSADENGEFSIDVKGLTHLNFQISMLGYETLIVHIHLTEGDHQVYELKPSHLQLNEVVVSMSLGLLRSENIVKVEQQKIPVLFENHPPSLMAALSSIPGVDQISTGTGIGKPVIRGLTGNRIVTYTQGIRLENQQFGSEHGLGENAVGISGVEVIKGPASLLYGADALGGVLFMVDEKFAPKDKIEGFIESGFDTNAALSQNSVGLKINKKIKWNLFGAYNSAADYQIPDGDYVFNSRFDELSLKSSLGYNQNNWAGNIRYSYLENNFGIPEDGTLSTNQNRSVELPYQNITQHMISTQHSLFFGPNELVATLGYNNNHRIEYEEVHEEEENPDHTPDEHEDVGLDMILQTLTYDLKGKIRIQSEKSMVLTGIQGMLQTNANFGHEILIPNAETNDVGIYAVLQHEISDKLSIEGGTRLDRRMIDTEAYTSPEKDIPVLNKNFIGINYSAGAVFHWNETQMRANVSTGFRPPTTSELLSNGEHHGTLRYEIGNPDLISEKAFQADLSLEFNTDHLQFGINPFANFINNYIYLSPNGQFVDDLAAYDYQQTDALLYGGEISFHLHPHDVHWLHIESSFSSVLAEDQAGNPLPLIPANRINSTFRAEFQSEHKLRLKNIFINHLFKFDQDRVADSETSSANYMLFSAGLVGELKMTKHSIDLRIGVNNLFNTEYIDHLSRLKPDQIPNPGRNFFITAKWNWAN